MKTAFLIAGFNMNQTAADDKYDLLRNTIAAQGYKVVPVPFMWNHTTVAQYTDKFIDFYNKNKSEYNIVIGNSYGAMVAFLSAPKIVPNKVLLCSLSPYFREDKDKTTEEYRVKRFGRRRDEAMAGLSAEQTARDINKAKIEVVMLYGEQEKRVYPHLVERVRSTAKDLKSVQLVEVPDAPHPFRYPAYVKGIELVLAK